MKKITAWVPDERVADVLSALVATQSDFQFEHLLAQNVTPAPKVVTAKKPASVPITKNPTHFRPPVGQTSVTIIQDLLQRRNNDAVNIAEIVSYCEGIGYKASSIRTRLKDMVDRKLIVSDGHGNYKLKVQEAQAHAA